MGTIYKVHHNLLDEVRVIKFMRAAVTGDPGLHHRFLQEAKLVTRFKHPNIAAVYDFAMDDDDTAYIVMEYVGGMNLNEMAAALPSLSVALVLELTAQTLDALGYLHRKNVVHRDISPDNIMAVVEDDTLRVKLIDLGIAKALDASEAVTKTGFFLGKLKYASPEQLGTLQGDERMDGRSDLYSLGVVMYQLLTGRMPFAGESAQALIAGHLIEAPAPFEKSDPQGRVPVLVRDLVLKTLAKKRADRYGSAEEMRRAIVEVQQQLPEDPLTTEREQLRKTMREQEQSQAAAQAATPSAQQRMNRRFDFAEVTPHPTPVGERTLEPTAAVRPPKSPRRAEPTQQSPASTLDATVAATTTQKSWLNRRWLAATSTAMVVLLGSAVMLQVRKTAPSPGDAIPAAGVATPQAVPQPDGRPAPSVAVAETTTPPTMTSVTLSSEQAQPSPRQAQPVVAPSRPRVKTVGTETRGGALPMPAPVAVAEPPPASEPRVARTAPAPEPVVTRPPESERPREVPPAPREERQTPVATADAGVREAIAEFVGAQEALDAGRYVAVFPSADRGRITTAFNSFRSQKLDLTIDTIEVNGARATVRAREERVATPKVGSVQRLSVDRVITLQRAGGKWVVVGIR